MIKQGFLDDIDTDMCGDFFDHIDDLLDFPNEEIGGGDVGSLESCWPTAPDVMTLSGSSFSGHGCGSSSSQSQSMEDDLAAELSVPCEDIAQLEWLSNFVEDSFSVGSIDLDSDWNKDKDKDSSNMNNNKDSFHTSSPVSVLDGSSSSSSSSSCSGNGKPMPLMIVPGRARSKRPRPPSFSPRTIPLEFNSFAESPKKMIKKKLHPPPTGATTDVRKCMHCQIQKTPQWRMGPMGPKTLCNACGVRYKSGRLYPEYRPAASPNYVATLHSNSHKKVLEMRVKSGQKAPAPIPEFVRKTSHMLDCA